MENKKISNTKMITFQMDNFDKYYESILNDTLNGSYVDPDSTKTVDKINYYSLLTKFLNKQEKKNYTYLEPIKVLGIKKENIKEEMDDYKIVVLENDKSLFKLTSDQLGFSAIESIYFDSQKENYPLPKLLNEAPKEKKEEIIKLITEYVKNSRTLGGAFVWPTSGNTRNCLYNLHRGNRGYIEDRVDLTLLEVKHALDGEYDEGNYTDDILYTEYMKEETHMKKWLKHFNSFDDYISFFMLEDFIKDGMPINIVTGEPLTEDDAKRIKKQKGELKNLKYESLKEMLLRVENMIISRTMKMEEKIKPLVTDCIFDVGEMIDLKDFLNVYRNPLPLDYIVDAIEKEIPKGSLRHKKIKQYIDNKLGMTSSNGCTYNTLIRLVWAAIRYTYPHMRWDELCLKFNKMEE